MRKLFYGIVSCTMFILSICLLLMLLNLDYNNLYIYICNILTIILLSFYVYNVKKKNISKFGPLTIFLIFYWIYYFGGIYVYYIRDKIYFNYDADINFVSSVYAISILIIMIISQFMIIMQGRKKNNLIKIKQNVNLKKCKIAVIAVALIGWVGAYKVFNGFTTIPFFSVNKDLARINLNASGFSWFLMQFLQINIIFCGYILICRKLKVKDKIYYSLIILFSFIPLFLYVGRSLFLIPLITIIMIMLNFKKVSNMKILILGIVVMGISLATIYFRLNTSGEFEYQAFQEIALQDTFPEVRMFGICRNIMDTKYFENVYINNILSPIPSKLLNLVNYDKSQMTFIGSVILSEIGTYINAGGILGIRISLIGETYLGGGTLAIVFMSIFIALILTYMEILFKQKENLEKLVLIISSVLLGCFVPYGYTFIVPTVQMTLIATLIKMFVSEKSIKKRLNCKGH